MKLILTQSEAIERLRHFLAIGADVQVIISRPRAKTSPKPKSEPVPDTRTPHRRVFEEINKLDFAGKDKIKCIKILRDNFDLSLWDAKDIVEQWHSECCNAIFATGLDRIFIRKENGTLDRFLLIPRK